MLEFARAFGIPDNVNLTQILFIVVGCLALLLVLVLVATLIIKVVRNKKVNKVINNCVLSDDELDSIVIEHADFKKSDDDE